MRHFSLLHAPAYAFYSKELYRDVAYSWSGIGLRYLMFVLFVGLLIPAIISFSQLSSLQRNNASIEEYESFVLLDNQDFYRGFLHFIKQFPTIYIQDGKASADIEQPHYIYTKQREPYLIIDTTGKITSLEQHKAEMLITAEGLIIKEKGRDKMRMPFKHEADETIDKYMFLSWIPWLPIVYLPFNWLVHFIVYAINALIFGLFGLALCRWMQVNLDYSANIRLAAVTSTPLVLLMGLSLIFGTQFFTKPTLVYIIIHGAYMYHAVESNKIVKS